MPRRALLLFAAGLATNLVLSLLPVRDILQTGGSLLRYIGLMGTGYAVLFGVATRKG